MIHISINKSIAILLITGVLLLLIGITVADSGSNSTHVNSTGDVNANGDSSDDSDQLQNGSKVSATMSWVDKTTVSGKIRNFLKDFKYQSGFNFMGSWTPSSIRYFNAFWFPFFPAHIIQFPDSAYCNLLVSSHFVIFSPHQSWYIILPGLTCLNFYEEAIRVANGLTWNGIFTNLLSYNRFCRFYHKLQYLVRIRISVFCSGKVQESVTWSLLMDILTIDMVSIWQPSREWVALISLR